MQIMNFLSLLLLFYFYNSYAGVVEIDSRSHLRKEWEQYKQKYNLMMNGEKDEERFKVFVQNTEDIKKLNAKNTGTVFGMNRFGHWTDEEFMNYMNRGAAHIKTQKNAKKSYTESGKNFPDIDWRQKGVVTPIKDQGKCGSCWAFSSTGMLESQYAILKKKKIGLSEQDLVDCSKSFWNNGCYGGGMSFAFKYVQQIGINSELDYPYVAKELPCKHNDTKSILKVDEIYRLPGGNESALASAVSTFGPVSIKFAGTNTFKFYKSGIFIDPTCNAAYVNHGMVVVGLGSKPSLHYIVRNSYGESWGIDGYILVARDHNNMCGIASAAIFASVALPK